jgi:hypothetical protein
LVSNHKSRHSDLPSAISILEEAKKLISVRKKDEIKQEGYK